MDLAPRRAPAGERAHVHPFEFEQRDLAIGPTTVAADAGCGDNAVARDEQSGRVRGEGRSGRASGARIARGEGYVAIGVRLAPRYVAGCLPDSSLKLRAGQLDRKLAKIDLVAV